MKLRALAVVGAGVAALGIVWLAIPSRHGGETGVVDARRELRQQGFKTELSEFAFRVEPEVSARGEIFTRTGNANPIRDGVRPLSTQIMRAASMDGARVLWNQEELKIGGSSNL